MAQKFLQFFRNRYRWIVLSLITLCLSWGLLHPIGQLQPLRAETAPSSTPQIPTALNVYRPVGEWVGRLILPPKPTDGSDWVWFEVQHSPNPELVGQTVRLQWQDTPDVQARINRVQQDINLSAEAHQSLKRGNIHPQRLDGRQQVGPLQSLAGARPTDDLLVRLKAVQVVSGPSPHLEISEDPVQVAGFNYGLVKILGPVPTSQSLPQHCPGLSPCPSELTQVRHYNPATQRFNGPKEVVHIRQDQPNSAGVFQSTPRKLAASPAGQAGWYIYGSKNTEGRFEVNGIAPRSLFQLQPDRYFSTPRAGLHYFKRNVWQQTAQHKGKLQRALVDNQQRKQQAALDQWQEGDQFLVVHLFGGIGGNKAEPQAVIGTVTGHFGYGVATVIKDAFTGERQFDIEYQQVYAHNPEGIVAGPTHWSEYMGHLNRGWLGSRPVLDVLVKSEALTQPYQFGEMTLDPLAELKTQLQLMAARYRMGDGTGSALVTPAKSCVQDSSQAVYQTIKRIQYQVQMSSAIQTWLADHPQDPQALRFQELTFLGNALEKELVPLGIVRRDWQQNAQVAAGIATPGTFRHSDDVLTQVLSWRTLIPRVAQDQIIRIFLNQGTPLWFLNTNQVGGWDGDISPLAPTELFGKWPIVSFSFSRLVEATTTFPTPMGWLVSGLVLGGYGFFAIDWGRKARFLAPPQFSAHSLSVQVKIWVGSFIMPALVEELLFRCLLIPHPQEGVWWVTLMLWSGFSLILFVLYHPLNARTLYKAGDPTFFNPRFLILATVLGMACTGTYLFTGSIWPGTIIHWLAVAIWLLYLGGQERLNNV